MNRRSAAMRIVLGGGFSLAVVLGIGGCGEDEPLVLDQTAPVASPRPVKAAASAPAKAPEAASTPTEVVVKRFKPARDPFRSIYQNRARITPEGGAKHPLQQYSIGQLKLLGIISGIAEPVALVSTPSGEEYVVRTGTPVGTGDGRVVAILPDRVVIVEKYYDYRGQLQTEKYELVLAEEGK